MRHQFGDRGVDRAAIGVAVFNGVFTESLVGDNKQRCDLKILVPLSEFAEVFAFDVDSANEPSTSTRAISSPRTGFAPSPV